MVDYPVFTGQAIRYGLAAVILAALFQGQLRRPSLPELLQLAALAALGLAAFNVLLIAALREADPAAVRVVVGGVPVVLAVVGPLVSGERLSRRVVGAAVIVTAGVAGAIDRLGAARAGLFAGLVPIAALATSAAIGLTLITPLRLAGALVVCGGVILGVSRPLAFVDRWQGDIALPTVVSPSFGGTERTCIQAVNGRGARRLGPRDGPL